MKEKNFFLKTLPVILFALTLVISCKKDDNFSSADLVGTWTLSSESIELEMKVNGKTMKQYLIDKGVPAAVAQEAVDGFYDEFYGSVDEQIGTAFAGTMTFKSDGTYTATSDGETENGTWSLNDNKLTLTANGETIGLDVEKLTKSELLLSMKESENIDIDNDGKNERLDLIVKFKFIK